MKNILLVVFTMLSFSVFGQSNELSFSFQPVSKNVFGNQISLGYFRTLSPQFALGLKTGIRVYDENPFTGQSDEFEVYSKNIDLVNRWSIFKIKNFRVMSEFGISMRRELQNSLMSTFVIVCGVGGTPFPGSGPSTGVRTHLSGTNPQTNQFGYTSGVMIDFLILKSVLVGLDYNFKLYTPNESTFEQDYTYSSIFNINLGYKF